MKETVIRSGSISDQYRIHTLDVRFQCENDCGMNINLVTKHVSIVETIARGELLDEGGNAISS